MKKLALALLTATELLGCEPKKPHERPPAKTCSEATENAWRDIRKLRGQMSDCFGARGAKNAVRRDGDDLDRLGCEGKGKSFEEAANAAAKMLGDYHRRCGID